MAQLDRLSQVKHREPNWWSQQNRKITSSLQNPTLYLKWGRGNINLEDICYVLHAIINSVSIPTSPHTHIFPPYNPNIAYIIPRILWGIYRCVSTHPHIFTGAFLMNINGNRKQKLQNHNYDKKFSLVSFSVTMEGVFGKPKNISKQLPHS